MTRLQEHWEDNGLLWLSAPDLNAGSAVHGFSTRLGGVSRGALASLNLGTARGDTIENVRENFARFGAAVGFDSTKTVFSKQVHRDDIRIVTEADCGKGLYRDREYEADGLLTNIPGSPLAVFSADGVPILLHDPERHVAGACHAGWRGTALGIVRKMVEEMWEWYGSQPEHIHAAIGPGISRCCFETHNDVPEAMITALGTAAESYIDPLPGEKKLVDLKGLNAHWLRQAGVPAEQIVCSDLCTSCRQDWFWSHRHTGDARGVMSAVIQLM